MENLEAQISDELRRIIALVGEFTALTPRWSGKVELVPDADFKGKKRFSCDIHIDASLAAQPLRWATLIHEALHCVSAGYNRDDYQAFRGWEEGTVEQLQRLLRPVILNRLGISVEAKVFHSDEATHSYNHYIAALEQLRSALYAEEEIGAVEFYTDLLSIPIRRRPGHILGLVFQQPGALRFQFVQTFSAANSVLIGRLI